MIPARSGSRAAPLLAAAIALLGALAALYLAWPIRRMLLPLQIDVNDAWNAFQVDDLLAGRSLYPGPEQLVANNYPPLSFYVIAAISRFGFDPMLVGRALSVVAVLVIAGAIFAIVRHFNASRTAALVGGLWFCATLARFFDSYVGLDDPSLMALAVMVMALAWFLRRISTGRAPEPAVALMVLAGFIKHNIVAVPITALVWLAWTDRRAALRAAAVGGIAATAGLGLCGLIYGGAFFQNLMMPRAYSVQTALEGVGRLQWIAPGLIAAGLWAWQDRKCPAARFTALFLIIAFVFQFVQKLGVGVSDNAEFELLVACAVGIGLAFEHVLAMVGAQRLGAAGARLALLAVLIARLLLSTRTAPYLLIASPAFRADLQQRSAVVAAETARVAAMPGNVVCSVATVCAAAGKPFVYDPFAVQQRIITGHQSRQDVDRKLAALHAQFATVDPRTVADWR